MQTESVGVYYAGQDFRVESPAFFVERRLARQWLKESKAWSIHHGRDIALTPEMEECLAGDIDVRKLIAGLLHEDSCIMGEHVMMANVEEKIWARRMVRSWHRQVALEEHLRSLKRYQKMEQSGERTEQIDL